MRNKREGELVHQPVYKHDYKWGEELPQSYYDKYRGTKEQQEARRLALNGPKVNRHKL